MFKKNKREFDPDKDLKVVTTHYTHKGKVIKTEERLKAKRYFFDGDSYWSTVHREDKVIEINNEDEAKAYGVTIDG